MATTTFNKKKAIFKSKLNSNLRKKLVKFYISIIVLYGDEIWTLPQVNQNYLKSFKSGYGEGWRSVVPIV